MGLGYKGRKVDISSYPLVLALPIPHPSKKNIYEKKKKKMSQPREFPGGLVVRICCYSLLWPGFNPQL